MNSILILKGLAKSYPGRPVFNDIGASIEAGKSLAVTGPNGSGKTTLLRIICGFLRPTRGNVIYRKGGMEFSRLDIRDYIGLVSPDLILYDELTALENLRFFGSVAGFRIDNSELRSRLERVGLGERGNDRVGSYSSGMKQRLKYCLALLRDPEILILDEPTANLDEKGKAMVFEIIKSFRGILVMATNEKSELEYGEQVIRLDK